MFKITLNGKPVTLDVSPDTPLLWALRESAGLSGTKFGCGEGSCGACTVHINGVAIRSCVIPTGSINGASIKTIEGLSEGEQLHPVQNAWLEEQVPQCGYCQSGMIMAVTALLEQNPSPSDADIDANITNICRCGTYERIRKAIHRVSKESNNG